MTTHYFGGKIYQGEGVFAESIFVSEKGKVVDADSFANSEFLHRVDLKGSLVLPAFRDGHAHPLFAGRESKGLAISHCKTEEEVLQALRSYRIENPATHWIDGAVFDRSIPALFHRTTLDKVVDDVPVVLHGDDHHTLWVNTKALEVAELIGPSSTNINTPGVDMDEDGIPTGILREWPAMRLILDLEPKHSVEEDVQNLVEADRRLAAAGVVECYDAWIDPGMAETYLAAADSGVIELDYKLCFRADPFTFNQDLSYIKTMREQTNLRRQLDGNSIKFFIDGVFGSATAMVQKPYETTGEHGSPVWDADTLRAAIKTANDESFQIHIHAIGDAALSLALDILEEIPQETMSYRPILIHVELTDEPLIKRMISVNAIACVQPYWAQHNGMLNSCLSHLGSERLSSLYAFKLMLELGASVAFSSDWPVSSHEPLKGISVAVNRRETAEQKPHNISQAITLDQAVYAYTQGVQSMRVNESAGLLSVGSSFDAIVLDADVFNHPTMDLSKVSVLATYKAGRKIF